jgi:hypothetical protein
MIKKIVSGGQTGADQAALDAAIELGVQHGGWIPKGRPTETGPLPEKYKLQEMPTSSYPKRTEQNVIDSDGTVIFSHGKLKGGSVLTQKLAKKHNRPCLHIDMSSINPYAAVKAINYWLKNHDVQVLNVAGSRLSKDPEIYEATKTILKSVLHLHLFGKTDALDIAPLIPTTVEEAVDHLVSSIPLRDKTRLATMKKEELYLLYPTLGRHIRARYGLWSGNEGLMESCRKLSGQKDIHPDSASALIIMELWKRLQESHALRVVK